jgi:hypothetical protein
MVLHKYGDRLYNGVAQALTRQLQTVASRVEAAQVRGRRRRARGGCHLSGVQRAGTHEAGLAPGVAVWLRPHQAPCCPEPLPLPGPTG